MGNCDIGNPLLVNQGTNDNFVWKFNLSKWKRFLTWLFPRQYPAEEWYDKIIGYAIEDSSYDDEYVAIQLL